MMVWAFLYGIWIKGIIQWLANRWHVLTGIPVSVATGKVIGRWFNIFLAVTIPAVMPIWWNILSSLSAQVIWVATGRPAPLIYYWAPIVVLTTLLI
ncbi:MAG: hypothetical protein RQ885_15690, partial [Desulfurococcales archaeon]|nr:hypothetical protein [Desulfurococcales archaeon]